MATISTYLDTRVANKDGLYAIKLVFRNKSTVAHLATGYNIPCECWGNGKIISSRIKSIDAKLPCKASVLNTELAALLSRATLHMNEITGKKSNMSATIIRDKVRDALEGRNTSSSSNDTLLGVMAERNPESSTNKCVYSFICKHYTKADTILLDDIDETWVEGLCKKLTDNLATNSAGLYYAQVKAAWHYAQKKHYIGYDVDPFRSYTIGRVSTKSRALEVDAVREIWFYESKSDSRRELNNERARDYFRISFGLCGMNAIDIYKLSMDDVVSGRIITHRSKTNVDINIKIEPEVQEMIDKYNDGNLLFGKLFRQSGYSVARNTLNNWLQGLRPGLTTYYARHTWMSLGAELDIPDRTLFAGIAHRVGKYSDETYITFRHRKLDLANRKILDFVLQKGEFAPDSDEQASH